MSENVTNVNVNETQKSEKKEEAVKPAKIIIAPQEFKTHTEGQITTTSDLTKLINELFGAAFNDFVGCKIYVWNGSVPIPQGLTMFMGMGNFYVDLYFEKNNSNVKTGIMDNLIPANSSDNSSNFARLNRVCGGGVSRAWALNKDTKDALVEFVPGYVEGMKNFNPNWDLRIVEESVPMNSFSGVSKITVRVMGFDLNAIVGKIYGTHEDYTNDDSRVKYDYQCLPIMRSNKGFAYGYNVMNPNMAYNIEFVVQILRNDRSIISAMQDAIGMIPVASGDNFVRYNRS